MSASTIMRRGDLPGDDDRYVIVFSCGSVVTATWVFVRKVHVFRGRKTDNDDVVLSLCSFVNGYFYHDYAFLDWNDVVIQFLGKVNDGVVLKKEIGERILVNLDLP
ncbi:unnamed protein product [Heligmosomoides polygyrus]|uniref:DUF223 domain-containing protein n=1 Tax=Heligmosomoides polygyrus TaxID=6339 RepID=A0A183GUD5_HELPZ|nr:unnamed protein product [Heligmosomoides polygyrus]